MVDTHPNFIFPKSIDEALKEAYQDYYPEIAKDDELFAEIKKADAEVFFLRLSAMQDKLNGRLPTSDDDHKLKYPDLINSASDMLNIYINVIVKADKLLNNTLNKAMDGDTKAMSDIEKMMTNPLYMSAQALSSNEMVATSEKDVKQLRQSASMNTLNQIIDNSPEIQNMIGDMRARANLAYAEAGITPNFSRDDTAPTPHKQIADYIDEHPKAILALAMVIKQRQALGMPTENIESVTSLARRCSKDDVQAVAKEICYTAPDNSLTVAAKTAERFAITEKKRLDSSRII